VRPMLAKNGGPAGKVAQLMLDADAAAAAVGAAVGGAFNGGNYKATGAAAQRGDGEIAGLNPNGQQGAGPEPQPLYDVFVPTMRNMTSTTRPAGSSEAGLVPPFAELPPDPAYGRGDGWGREGRLDQLRRLMAGSQKDIDYHWNDSRGFHLPWNYGEINERLAYSRAQLALQRQEWLSLGAGDVWTPRPPAPALPGNDMFADNRPQAEIATDRARARAEMDMERTDPERAHWLRMARGDHGAPGRFQYLQEGFLRLLGPLALANARQPVSPTSTAAEIRYRQQTSGVLNQQRTGANHHLPPGIWNTSQERGVVTVSFQAYGGGPTLGSIEGTGDRTSAFVRTISVAGGFQRRGISVELYRKFLSAVGNPPLVQGFAGGRNLDALEASGWNASATPRVGALSKLGYDAHSTDGNLMSSRRTGP
ncbi:MAG TPA: hypothetical protein VK324_15215, partial [Tepidisphaeraceae bacterium]|nr:hypothetical protein [Tepidisphaeraceae bacterium]